MQITNMPSGPLGVNTYLVTDEYTNKAFIVDPGGWTQKMKDHVMSTGAELEYIILTHGHADHIMGIPALKEDFPDVNLKAVGHGSDSDGNRLLSEEENRTVSSIACSPEFISDLTRD